MCVTRSLIKFLECLSSEELENLAAMLALLEERKKNSPCFRVCARQKFAVDWYPAANAPYGFFAAAAFLATALPFFFTAFLRADFDFRVRIAFFCIDVRFVGMVIPLAMS
jgi:hypothetical protein